MRRSWTGGIAVFRTSSASARRAAALQVSISGLPGLAVAAAGWLVCLLCFLPFYIKGGMAAGDVKLMAAVGAFIGPVPGVIACAFTLVAGGVIGLLTLACARGHLRPAGSSAEGGSAVREALRTRIPYAGAIAAGTSVVLLFPSLIPPAFIQTWA